MVNQGNPVLPTAEPIFSINSVTLLYAQITYINDTSHFIFEFICHIIKLHMKVNLSEHLNIAPVEVVCSAVTPSCTASEQHTASTGLSPRKKDSEQEK